MLISWKVNKPHNPLQVMNIQQFEIIKYHNHIGVRISGIMQQTH